MTENYKKLSDVPDKYKKKIGGGRLKGMTDIKPQWRYMMMDSVYGECGIGWWYTIDRLWIEEGGNEEKTAMAMVSVYYKQGDKTSNPVMGVGGSMLVAKERNGLFTSDEAYKMAVTDALGVAFKYLGMASSVYMGEEKSKYEPRQQDNFVKQQEQVSKAPPPKKEITYKFDYGETSRNFNIETWLEKFEVCVRDKTKHDIVALNLGVMTEIGRNQEYQSKLNEIMVLDKELFTK